MRFRTTTKVSRFWLLVSRSFAHSKITDEPDSRDNERETKNEKRETALLDSARRCFRQLLLGEVPLLHIEAVAGSNALGGVFLCLRSGHDHRLAGLPVRRCGAGVGVGSLQGFEDAQDLVDVAAERQRIIQQRPDNAL